MESYTSSILATCPAHFNLLGNTINTIFYFNKKINLRIEFFSHNYAKKTILAYLDKITNLFKADAEINKNNKCTKCKKTIFLLLFTSANSWRQKKKSI